MDMVFLKQNAIVLQAICNNWLSLGLESLGCEVEFTQSFDTVCFIVLSWSWRFWMRNCESTQRFEFVNWFYGFPSVLSVLDAKVRIYAKYRFC